MVSFAFKNHYERLGLASNASEEDIRRAYRQLARQYHPDVAKNKSLAQDMFILLSEAHRTLTDPGLRRRYDAELEKRERVTSRYVHNAAAEPSSRMRNTTGEDRAGVRTATWEFAREHPDTARARGFSWKAAGTARPRTRKRPDLDARANIEVPLEDAIHGALHTVTIECHDPGEQSHRLATYHVRIPAGVCQGQQLRLSGCGLNDASTGEAGDLYLKIHYARHKRFRVMGEQLFTELEIPVWEAATGVCRRIPVLDGDAPLVIPPGSQQGQRLTLKGFGMPQHDGSRGDMVVMLKLCVPAARTARQKELWKAIAREHAAR